MDILFIRDTFVADLKGKNWALGLVNFVPATCIAYHFCLNLPEKFSQPGAHFVGQPGKQVLKMLQINGVLFHLISGLHCIILMKCQCSGAALTLITACCYQSLN